MRGIAGSLVLFGLVGAAWTRVLAGRAEERFPPLGDRIEVGGLDQHVVVEGDGPPLVFVHGAYGATGACCGTDRDTGTASALRS